MADPLQKADAQRWVAEYSKSGRSTCKASKQKIEKDTFRIGKVIAGEDNPFAKGKEMTVWYLPEALFDSFRKGREGKSLLTSTDDLEGFADLKKADQEKIEQIIEEENQFRDGLSAVDDEATYLEHPEGKFWSIAVAGESTRVRYGKIGEEGSVSEKQHKDEAAAEKFKAKMLKEKLKKGYEEANKGGKKRAATSATSETKNKKQKKADVPAPAAGAGAGASVAKGEEGSLDALRFVCEYAKSGRSACKASKETIPQGALRIGKVVANPWRVGKEMSLWYLPEALFDSFRKGKAGKTYLMSTDDLEGFADLKKADQEKIEQIIEEENQFRDGLSAVDDEATYLEHPEGKFWSIAVAGESTRVRYGKIGEEGSVSEKQHKDEAAAEKFKAKMLKEKLKKGYEEAAK